MTDQEMIEYLDKIIAETIEEEREASYV